MSQAFAVVFGLTVLLCASHAWTATPAGAASEVSDSETALRGLLQEGRFCGIELGTQVAKLTGVVLSSRNEGQGRFNRGAEPLDLGGVELEAIEYVAAQGQLQSVILQARGRENAQRLVERFQAILGESPTRDRHGRPVAWRTERTVVQLQYLDEGAALVTMVSRAEDAP